MINSSRVVLSGIQRDNCVYSLDGHAMSGELNASVKEKDSLAQNYVLGKSHRVSFGVGRYTTQGVIDYVHSDLWGPSQVESLGGKRYFLSIVDDYSRRVWIYILGFKHEAFGKFRQWKYYALRVDCYDYRSFAGTQSRMGSRCHHLQRLRKKTPMEMWSGHPSDYEMLRIFGRVAYPNDKQGKLQPRAIKWVLLGYPKGLKRSTLKDSGAGADKSVEELQVEVELQRLNNHTPEEDQTDQDGDDEDQTDQGFCIGRKILMINEGNEGVQKPRYKTRLVARGFTRRADYELEQLDVKTVFLHGNLEEVVYTREPPGYEQGNMVCLLKKSLYGLKQSPRQWYRRFDEYMLSNGFKRSNYDSCSLLKKEFDMKELGEVKKILGMEIVRDQSHKILRVSQSGYISKILNNFRIDNGKSVKMSLGGHFKLSLKDYPVSDCEIYLANPGKNHWEAVKWILKYLRGTANVGLVYGTDHGNHVDVTGFVDLDYAKNSDKVRSITSYTFLVQGCVVSWKATLQHVVALSTTEAEYMAFTEAVNEAIWLRGLLEEFGVKLNTVVVNCDNQGAIHLSRNHVLHERTKHINVRYYFIREVMEAKTVKVLKVGT
ncbi:retrotransposon protein, putative, ty1-copia subclass [Tanacetum coccineum]